MTDQAQPEQQKKIPNQGEKFWSGPITGEDLWVVG